MAWTQTQARRLKELGLDPEAVECPASNPSEQNHLFQQIEKKQVKKTRAALTRFLSKDRLTRMERLSHDLSRTLIHHGFSRVTTPVIISKSALARMTITESHPLFNQVFWINDRQCLRPMLAPNLYSLMVDLGRLKTRPIRFFEIGSCFRKESDGARHNTEFTMLNLVEMGIEMDKRESRLQELAAIVAGSAGLENYEFQTESSEVYGTTLDLVAGPDRIEVASGAVGPHSLDSAWGVTDVWAGMGFGLERLLMAGLGERTIGKWGINLAYLNGNRLNV
ncbi:pyrrolysine--tRNA(Pyl) ligase large subunit [Desulfospira joergensenii]|uniref:pyrrolysine--tRNA(Pyl) ligase large subunit n=1 Tax=Desulfospira joergensenii TaxID=53329 RepID=UPI0003B74E60|nr:pyrrolysine--tRNA(Pyl) ligase large subunit [Desulfospira joergensenii]